MMCRKANDTIATNENTVLNTLTKFGYVISRTTSRSMLVETGRVLRAIIAAPIGDDNKFLHSAHIGISTQL